MKEVKKCSISGIAFTMEADAFQVLSRYLESLNDTYRNTDGGKEIVEDIEVECFMYFHLKSEVVSPS